MPEGGAVDPDARITANWLVSQPPETAGFEIFMGGFSFETDTALAIALSGSLSDQLTITPAFGNARTEPAGQTIWLQPGDQVLVPPLRGSNLAFLSVSAHFDLPPVFGSVGTSPNARIGGLDGGMLRAGQAAAAAITQPLSSANCMLNAPNYLNRGPSSAVFSAHKTSVLRQIR